MEIIGCPKVSSKCPPVMEIVGKIKLLICPGNKVYIYYIYIIYILYIYKGHFLKTEHPLKKNFLLIPWNSFIFFSKDPHTSGTKCPKSSFLMVFGLGKPRYDGHPFPSICPRLLFWLRKAKIKWTLFWKSGHFVFGSVYQLSFTVIVVNNL